MGLHAFTAGFTFCLGSIPVGELKSHKPCGKREREKIFFKKKKQQQDGLRHGERGGR